MEEAQLGKSGPALAQFLDELAPHAATPTGSGLDVPDWLDKLQHEARRVRAERLDSTGPARESLLAPRKMLSLDEVRRQLGEWEKG
jgi:hypothetical protein